MRPAWSGSLRMRPQVDGMPVRLEDDGGAADRELADAALAQPAADHDALGVLPFLEPQEAPDHRRELLRELLDGALDDAGRFGVAFGSAPCRAASC